MEFFLRKENEHIWNEVQKLAKDNNDKELYLYVLEAQRLTSTQRNMRVATQPATLDGQTVEPGNLVVMLLVSFQPNIISYSSLELSNKSEIFD